jgi:hypothetical protein
LQAVTLQWTRRACFRRLAKHDALRAAGASPALHHAALALVEHATARHSTFSARLGAVMVSTSQQRFAVFHAPFWDRLAAELSNVSLTSFGAAHMAHNLSRLRKQHAIDEHGETVLALVRRALSADEQPSAQLSGMVLSCIANDEVIRAGLEPGQLVSISSAYVAALGNAGNIQEGLCTILASLNGLDGCDQELLSSVKAPLAAAVATSVQHMSARGVVTAVRLAAKLELPLSPEARGKVARAAACKAPRMTPSSLALVLGTLTSMRAVLCIADAGRLGSAGEAALPVMNASEVVKTVYFLAAAHLLVEAPLQEGALAALGRVAPDLDAVGVGMVLRALARTRFCAALQGEALEAVCAAIAREAAREATPQHAAKWLSDLECSAFHEAAGAVHAAAAFNAVVELCTRLLPHMTHTQAAQVLEAASAPIVVGAANARKLEALRASTQAHRIDLANRLGAADVTEEWALLLRKRKQRAVQQTDTEYAEVLAARTSHVAAEQHCPEFALAGAARLGAALPQEAKEVLLQGVARGAPGHEATMAAHVVTKIPDPSSRSMHPELDVAIELAAPNIDTASFLRKLQAVSQRGTPVLAATRDALHAAAARLGPRMSLQEVASALTGLAGLGQPGLPPRLWNALRPVLVRALPDAELALVLEVMQALGALQVIVGTDVAAALHGALVRAAPRLQGSTAVSALRAVALLVTNRDWHDAISACSAAVARHAAALDPELAISALHSYTVICSGTSSPAAADVHRLFQRATLAQHPSCSLTPMQGSQVCLFSACKRLLF